MQIIKHGNCYKQYLFNCDGCGCIWEANSNEIRWDFIKINDKIQDVAYCNCPECVKLCERKERNDVY